MRIADNCRVLIAGCARYRRTAAGLGVAVFVVSVAVAVASGTVTGEFWLGVTGFVCAVVLLSAALIAGLRTWWSDRIVRLGALAGSANLPEPPVRLSSVRAGRVRAEDIARIESLERLYLHYKAAADRSRDCDLGPEQDAWSDMLDAKLGLGLCGWPGCRIREEAHLFCQKHDPRRTQDGRKSG